MMEVDHYDSEVTPFVGVWIETLMANMDQLPYVVTPFVGVWIETAKSRKK